MPSSFSKDDTTFTANAMERKPVFWKRLFYLPAEPVWYLTILFLNYVVIFYTLHVSVKTDCVDHVHKEFDTLIYRIDAIYVVDIILNIIILYAPTLSLEEWAPTYRPTYILIFEIMSVFPYKLILPLVPKEYLQVYCLATLGRLLRLARIIYFHGRHGRMSLSYFLRIVEFLIKLGIYVLICYSMLCNTICWKSTLEECDTLCEFRLTVLRILSKLCHYGLKDELEYRADLRIYWITYVAFTHYFSFIFVTAVAIAGMTVGMKDKSYFSYMYLNMFKALYRARVQYKVKQSFLDKTSLFFKIGWTNYGGLDTGQEFYRMLTPTISNEMMLEVSLAAFNHSNLFRRSEVQYLRCLALEVVQEFVMPGDYIYRKGDHKDKMMYLAEGTIDILSEEDGETPILSFVSGTCLGEATILFSYSSINCVRAKTFCEFQVLRKQSFIAAYQRYPEMCKQVVAQIKSRVNTAKKIHDISELYKRRSFADQRDVDTYTIIWLKNTLHKLMSTSTEMAFRHQFQNIYLIDEIDKKALERLVFSANYLDTLVIRERVATDSDPIFVRSKFPFIFQPYSVVTVIWECVITLLTLIIIFLVPYACFLTVDYVPGYNAMFHFINSMFVLDLLLQCCTAIKTLKVQCTTFLSISIARLQSISFWADILSCVPLEMYSPAILTTIQPNTSALLHLNRIIKVWRIYYLFRKWTKKFNVNILYLTFAKLICTQIYICYILFALLVYFEGSRKITLQILFDVIQIMTTVGLVGVRARLHIFYLLTQLVAVSFRLMFISRLSALFTLTKIGLLRIQNKANRIISLIKTYNLPELYIRRLKNNYECDWEFDYGRSSQVPPSFMADISTMYYAQIVENILGSTIRDMVFFCDLPNASFMDLYSCMKLQTRPSNETIIYNGDIMNEIQISFKGSLDVINVDGKVIKTIDTPQPLNLVDVLFDFPSMNTYVTKTHCIFIMIERKRFERFRLMYPEVNDWIKQAIVKCKDKKKAVIRAFQNKEISGVTPAFIYKTAARNSMHLFGYNLKPDSFEEYDYFVPFDHYYPFDRIRFLLLRCTILPHGYFIYCWEGVRSILAIVSAIVHFVNPLADDKYRPLFYGLYIYGLLDMYVRLHVCYYNELGVLIKHPIKTAKHYITHGFLMDLLAILPTSIDLNNNDHLSYFVANIVRLLPLSRYWQYTRCLRFSVIKPENKFALILYTPLILVLINYVGCFIINLQCDFSSKSKLDPNFIDFTCKNDSLLSRSKFHKPIDVVRAHLYGMYFAATFLNLYGFLGYSLGADETRTISVILCFLGQVLIFTIIAKILCTYSVRKSYLTEQQSAMRRLNSYMNTINVSKRLIKIVAATFEVKWTITKGKPIHSIMGPFTIPLQRDLFYEIYGERLLATSVFQTKSALFYRNVLDSLTYRLVPKGGYLSTINDIEKTTFILLNGIADILSPDGAKLTTITKGAMFGNLENKAFVRIGVSVVAISHVELFAIESINFHKILKHYPAVLTEYLMLRQIYLTYIPSRYKDLEDEEYLTEEDVARTSEGTDLCQAFSPHGVKMKVWNMLIVFYSCYLSILLDFYHMATKDSSLYVIIFLYLSDVLYIIYFLTLDRIAHEDAWGYLVTDLMKIKKRLRKNRLRMWMSIASLFPIDLIVLTSTLNSRIRYELFPLCRLNRALRLIHVVDYFSAHMNKVNIRFTLLKVATIICWTTFFVVSFACIITILSCHYPINLDPPVPLCKEITAMTPRKKLQFFARKIYLGIHILTVTGSSLYYPHAVPIIILFVCSFIIGPILQALVFGQVFALYNDLSLPKTRFKRGVERLLFFLNRENVSTSLISRIKTYIQLIWITTTGEIYPELLRTAPRYLRDAILNSAFGHLIYNHAVFANCHPDCLRQIVQKFEVLYFFQDNYIRFKGSIDESMYFVFTGRVIVLSDDNAKKRTTYITTLRAGDSFGVKSGLLRKTPHCFSYRCKRYSIIIRLNLDRWEYLLDFFPASKQEIYNQINNYEGM